MNLYTFTVVATGQKFLLAPEEGDVFKWRQFIELRDRGLIPRWHGSVREAIKPDRQCYLFVIVKLNWLPLERK